MTGGALSLAGVAQTSNTETGGVGGAAGSGGQSAGGYAGREGGNGGRGGDGGAGDPLGLPGVSNSKGSSGTKGSIGGKGVAGSAGTTNGQQLFSSGVSVTQQTLQLVITSPPPSSVAAGVGFNLTVDAETGSAAVDVGYDGPVSVQLSGGPGGATLGGTLTVNASNGVAKFSGISINAGGNGYAFRRSVAA